MYVSVRKTRNPYVDIFQHIQKSQKLITLLSYLPKKKGFHLFFWKKREGDNLRFEIF